MRQVFLDTSFLVALYVKQDALHHRANHFASVFQATALTTDWVLAEFANGMSRPDRRYLAVDFVTKARRLPQLRIIRADAKWFDLGWEIYSQRLDKDWSLTDCISFQVMRHHKLTDALTADHHFIQAGFNALLTA